MVYSNERCIMDLKTISDLVLKLNESSSSKYKKQILSLNRHHLSDILSWVYDPFIKFNMTSANIEKYQQQHQINDLSEISLESLLIKLSTRVITGHQAIIETIKFINSNIEYKDLIYKIINKDLKCRIDVKLINACYPRLIPEFNVALANDYSKLKKKPDFEKEDFYGSQKVDGVRVITIKIGNDVKFYSRTGKEFSTLCTLQNDILQIPGDFVLDGEVCVMNNDKEDFKLVMKEITRKNHTISKPRYLVFDYLEVRDFFKGFSYVKLSERLKKLNANIKETEHIKILTQILITERNWRYLEQNASNYGWEGFMVRKDCEYQGKRSNDLLKIKEFFDEEYTVTGIEVGKKGMVYGGVLVDVEVMASIVIQHKGHKVNVGSGWSDEQRIYYFKHPEEIIGKEVTVRYFEETSDSEGNISLRFPTIKYVHDKKREV